MTDENTATAPADTQGGSDANPSNGSDAGNASPSPFEGMDSTLIEGLGKLGVTDVQGGLKALLEKQSFIDSTQRFPGTDDPEKLAAFFDKVKPESLDAYPDPDLEKMDPNIPFDKDGYDAFKSIAHKHGLLPQQFQGVINDLLPELAGMGDRATAKLDETANAAKQVLIEELGGEQSEKFIEAQSRVNDLASQRPEIIDYIRATGGINEDGRVQSPEAFKMLLALAEVNGVGGAAKLDTSSPDANGDTGIDPETGMISDGAKAMAFKRSDPEAYERMVSRSR